MNSLGARWNPWLLGYFTFFVSFSTRLLGSEAFFTGGSSSFYFGSILEGVGAETVFTTPDKWPECPPEVLCCVRHTSEGDGRPKGTGEFVRSPSSTLGNYLSDFYSYGSGGLEQHGRIGLHLPLDDVDQDGLPDVIQPGKFFQGTVSGTVSWTSGVFPARSISCKLSREALLSMGNFDLDLTDGNGQKNWKGLWALYTVSGSIVYSKARPNDVELKLRFVAPDGSIQSYGGRGLMEVDAEGILRPTENSPWALAGNGGQSISIQEFALKRRPGKGVFVGGGTFVLPLWFQKSRVLQPAGCPDFQLPEGSFAQFKLLLNDSSDDDHDGVPDILTALPPTPAVPVFLTQPEPVYARPGEDVVLRVQVSGKPPILVQWYRGDQLLANAIGPVLTLRTVGAKDAGDYHATASNEHGVINSKAARVFVSRPSPEPRIKEPLKSLELKPGDPALFRVVADGEPELGYRWIKDGQELVGISGAELKLTAVSPPDIGDYSVIVSNRYGRSTSGPVALVVLGYPARPSMRGVRLTARGPEIDCAVRTGSKYRLETSVDAVVWSPLNLFTATNSIHTVKHNFATAQPARFYRLVALSSP